MDFSRFFNNKKSHPPDYLVTVVFALLVICGLAILASASSELGIKQFGDSYYYLKHQIYFGLSLGLVGFFLTSKVYYGAYNNKIFCTSILVFALILMLLVFTPLGITAKGATRWLGFGSISFQPAEFLKIAVIFYLSSWLAYKDHRQKKIKEGLLPFFTLLLVVCGVLVLQRSTSPAFMLIFVALVMYFVSGAKLKYLLGVFLVGVAAIALVVTFTPYRSERIFSFLNPEADPGGSGYQLIQAKSAIRAGGVFGVGYGQSVIKLRLPEPAGDSIFAVIGEEVGFVGSVSLVFLFGLLVVRMYMLAARMSDPFGRLLLIGIASSIGIQAFVNMAAMTGLVPLTGTPLPFISYGGTSLAVLMTTMGVAVNISKYSSES